MGAYSNAVLADAPVAYYKLNEASGTTAYDSSGYGRHATYGSNVTLNVAGLVPSDGDTAAKTSTTGVTVLTLPSSLSIPCTGAGATIEFWVQFPGAYTDVGGTPNIYLGAISVPYFAIRFLYSGTIYFYAGNSLSYISLSPSSSYATGAHHWVFTYDRAANTSAIYVDGTVIVSGAAGGAPTSGSWTGGAFSWTGTNSANIVTDQIAIYDKPLSAARIQAHYAAATQIPVSPQTWLGVGSLSATPSIVLFPPAWRGTGSLAATLAKSVPLAPQAWQGTGGLSATATELVALPPQPWQGTGSLLWITSPLAGFWTATGSLTTTLTEPITLPPQSWQGAGALGATLTEPVPLPAQAWQGTANLGATLTSLAVLAPQAWQGAGGLSWSTNAAATVTVDVYRQNADGTWVRIAKGLPAVVGQPITFDDWNAPAGTVTYKAVAISAAQGASDSAPCAFTLTLTRLWLHDVANPAGTARGYLSTNAQVGWQAEVAYASYAGRPQQVAEVGEHARRQVQATLVLPRATDDRRALETLLQRVPVVCLRTGRGVRVFGVVDTYAITEDLGADTADLTVNEIEYTEAV